MINYKPLFAIAAGQPEQKKLRSKFGGRPWGLDKKHWPNGMSLLAQLVHEPPMIDLGGDYVLHLWHWNTPEQYRDPPEYEFHCDVSTLVRREELGDSLTPAPQGQPLIGEVYIQGWEEVEDNAPDDWYPLFFDDYSELLDRETGDINFGGGLTTKFGGPPCWQGTNAIENAPKESAFVFQTDAYIPIAGPMPSKEFIEQHALSGIMPSRKGDSYIYVITDFASDGSAFVFLDKNQEPPLPLWTWSR